MNSNIAQAPTVVTMTLQALARFPDRRAFVRDGGSLTYGHLRAGRPSAGRHGGGEASPVDLASTGDHAIINYTSGMTGKSKGAIRRHHVSADGVLAVSADVEFPARLRYLVTAPITHVSGTKVLPSFLRGGEVHLLKGFDPEKFLATLEREKINSRSWCRP